MAAPSLRRPGAALAGLVPAGSTDWLKGARVAWAGIGAPQRLLCDAQARARMSWNDRLRDHQ
jgi:hypothetical protein